MKNRFFMSCTCTGLALAASVSIATSALAGECGTPGCPANLDNGDGLFQVDGADLGALLADWGQTGTCSDLVGGGDGVDGADLGELLASWGACPASSCPASDHDCCTAGGVGCTDLACCDIVCALDSFCCDVSWDGLCVSSAAANCGDANGTYCGGGSDCPASDHDCCTAGGVGCTDLACCDIVCGLDAFCCETEWDILCINSANANCGDANGTYCGGGSTCPPSDHDCFTEGGPGCTDVACCDTVCALDAFCCDTAWDALCVNSALANCGAPECPFECDPGAIAEGEPCGTDTNGGCNTPPSGVSTCCFAQATPGCDDQACQDLICGQDPFCCDTQWDGICAGAAQAQCGLDCVGNPTDSFQDIACGNTICGNAWATGGTRDTDWYEITLGPGNTEVTFSIANNLPMVIGIVDTGGIPDCSLATALDPFAVSGLCGTASFTACLSAGTYWFFAAPNAFDGFPCDGDNTEYQITLTCGGDCDNSFVCPVADHDCCTQGGPGCTDLLCCEIVCTADSFCCDTSWDALCVAAADANCGGCTFACPPSDHDCCTEGGPGCTDLTCCEIVCTADSFCCATAWDALCVAAADANCGGCGGGASNCCVANGGLGCDDAECQAIVCGLDSFCCDTQWDTLCANSAIANCAVCGGGGGFDCPASDHDCCTEGAVGCTDLACCEIVCTADPFCCETEWDSVCVAAADANCGGCGGGASNCCVPNGGLGCDDAACQALVCGADAFCCETQWDTLCANAALAGCEVCGGGGTASNCCVANGGLGCDDQACQDLVCGADAFCCDVQWDTICANAAIANCAVCQ